MKNLRLASLMALCSVSALSAGCGGSSGDTIIGGPACGTGPCGGDITGTWNVTDVCMNKSTLMKSFVQDIMDSCSGASLANVDAGPAGSFVFNSDASYTMDITMTISVGVNLPLSCFPAGTTCAQVDAAFQSGVSGDPSVQAASCTGTGPCVCTVTEVPQHLAETGTYSVSGSTLLTTPAGQSTADSTAYCAKGSTLVFKDSVPDPTNPVTAIIGTKS